MNANALRRTFISCATLLVAGCATAPGQPSFGTQVKNTFASEDPCSNNARNIGIVGGAVLGALIGNAMGGKDESRLIGAALGGVVGGFIGADMDRKRCELSKVAKKYDLDITFANIESHGDVKPINSDSEAIQSSNNTAKSIVMGSTVTVRDKQGAGGHFESGSDRLTPKAQEYFAAIADQYAPEPIVAAQLSPKRKEEARKQLAQRRILLVGHTDDTGSSQLNADLSERRARAVAAFLKQKGVPETNLYYQGAGETLPIADNRTEEGRTGNRRVEIVEVADEAGFKKFLENRKPQYAFYRPQQSDTSVIEKATPSSKNAKSSKTEPVTTGTQSKAVLAQTASQSALAKPADIKAKPVINFGGSPYSPANAKIDTGVMIAEKGFSLISKAYADDGVLAADCSYDRPRSAGSVKSLREGRIYKTSEHLPQLYGKTWASDVNGNLVVLNRLAVLRDSGAPANLPELKVYADYKPGSNTKPQVNEEPEVNSYLVDKGVLYRIFPKGQGGLKCMDLLFGTDGATVAKAGKILYSSGTSRYVADFKPQLQ